MHVIFKSFYWRFGKIHFRISYCLATDFLLRSLWCSYYFIGLSYGTDDQSLKEAFVNYGEVVEGKLWLSLCFLLNLCRTWLYSLVFSYAARIIIDRESGRSRGFGFVTFTSSEEASVAISGMDGKVHMLCCCFCLCSHRTWRCCCIIHFKKHESDRRFMGCITQIRIWAFPYKCTKPRPEYASLQSGPTVHDVWWDSFSKNMLL